MSTTATAKPVNKYATNQPMPFGKYEGVPVHNLETDYLFWLLSQRRWFKADYYGLHAAVEKVAMQRLLNDAISPPIYQVEGQSL